MEFPEILGTLPWGFYGNGYSILVSILGPLFRKSSNILSPNLLGLGLRVYYHYLGLLGHFELEILKF